MRITYLLLLVICSLIALADVLIGSLTFTGKVYENSKLIQDDSLKVVYFFNDKKNLPKKVYTIPVDKNGRYEMSLEYTIPCPSSRFPNCDGLSRDSCFHINSLKLNPDSIGFIYGSKEIKVASRFWEISKQKSKDSTMLHDLYFQ